MTPMASQLTVRDRLAALDHLEQTARYLNRLAAWLGEQGCETESDMTNESAKGLLAACWFLSRPIRAQPPPEQWRDGQQTAQRQPDPAYPQASAPPREM
jgi:hypothetical protein